MVDNLSREDRSRNMRAIKSKSTSLEERVSKELWRRGFRFRRNVKGLFGKPDIAIKKYKLVIFLDSCFWHGCDLHYRIPKSNYTYWYDKIERNRCRDNEVNDYYHSRGWNVIRIWEHEIKDNFPMVLDKLTETISTIKHRLNK